MYYIAKFALTTLTVLDTWATDGSPRTLHRPNTYGSLSLFLEQPRRWFVRPSSTPPLPYITSLQDHNAPWTPSLVSGSWTAVSQTTKLGSKSSGTLGGSAKTLSCSRCSSEIVGYIGGPNKGTLTFNSVSFKNTGENTVQISYGNGDSTQRYCTVTVNGQAHILAFLPTGGPQSLGISVLNADFKQGNSNVISFSAYNGQYCKHQEDTRGSL